MFRPALLYPIAAAALGVAVVSAVVTVVAVEVLELVEDQLTDEDPEEHGVYRGPVMGAA